MIDINGFKWQAQFNDNALDSDCLAYTNYKGLTIYIGNEAKNNDTQLMYHLRHEVTHAYLYSYGFKTKEEFKRFTKRIRNHVVVEDVNGANERLADIEDLMQKYQIKDVKALRNIILDYDDMAKFVVEMGLGEEVKIDEN